MRHEIHAPKNEGYWKLRRTTQEGVILHAAILKTRILEDATFHIDPDTDEYHLQYKDREVSLQAKVPQDVAVKTLVCRLIAPPHERDTFQREVNSIIMRDAGLQTLPSKAPEIARKVHEAFNENILPPHIMDGTVEIRTCGNPSGARATDYLTLIAKNVDAYASHVFTPSLLCDEPLILARLMVYSYYDVPAAIYADGIRGAVNTINIVVGHMLLAAAQKGAFYVPNHAIPKQMLEGIYSIMNTSKFRSILYTLTATSNGVLFPNIRDLTDDPPLITYQNGDFSISPEYRELMHRKMTRTNEIGRRDKTHVSHVTMEGMTTAGCPVPHRRKALVDPEDILNVAWLPSDWESCLRVPYDELENPIDTLYKTVLNVVSELIQLQTVDSGT